MRPLLMLTWVTLLLIPTGCGLTLGPTAERETVWARAGTSGKVVGQCETEILITTEAGEKRSKANIQGMIVIDEPTYELLLKMWKARDRVDIGLTPGMK